MPEFSTSQKGGFLEEIRRQKWSGGSFSARPGQPVGKYAYPGKSQKWTIQDAIVRQDSQMVESFQSEKDWKRMLKKSRNLIHRARTEKEEEDSRFCDLVGIQKNWLNGTTEELSPRELEEKEFTDNKRKLGIPEWCLIPRASNVGIYTQHKMRRI